MKRKRQMRRPTPSRRYLRADDAAGQRAVGCGPEPVKPGRRLRRQVRTRPPRRRPRRQPPCPRSRSAAESEYDTPARSRSTSWRRWGRPLGHPLFDYDRCRGFCVTSDHAGAVAERGIRPEAVLTSRASRSRGTADERGSGRVTTSRWARAPRQAPPTIITPSRCWRRRGPLQDGLLVRQVKCQSSAQSRNQDRWQRVATAARNFCGRQRAQSEAGDPRDGRAAPTAGAARGPGWRADPAQALVTFDRRRTRSSCVRWAAGRWASSRMSARDTILERDVALKVMVAAIADDPELIAALLARSEGRREDDAPQRGDGLRPRHRTPTARRYIAMELLKGQDLQKAVRDAAADDAASARWQIIVQVLAGPRPRAPGRHRAPRHQARQHLHQPGRHGEDHGLRGGPPDHRLHDRHRQHRGHRRLHVARSR